MKKYSITCDVVQDLLPLYQDDCCSEQSKKIVVEHLSECEICKKKCRQYREQLPNVNESEEIDVKGIKKGIRNINKWKIRGIISLCLVFSLIFVVLPIGNYIRGEGLTYANLKAAYIAYAFERALVSGDYEKAYRYLAIESHYDNLLETDRERALLASTNGEASEEELAEAKAVDEGIRKIEENGFDWYDEVCKEKFMENMKTLENSDEMINSFSGFYIESQPEGWIAHFDVRTSSGQDLRLQLDISSDGIEEFSPILSVDLFDDATGELVKESLLTQKALMYDRLYRTPTVNEPVMEILYENTDFDWVKLFTY